MIRQILTGAFALSMLGACAAPLQTTSGADYLARYEAAGVVTASELDEEIRQIAAVEPNIDFPARIGLARIEHGVLTAIPEAEGHVWADFAAELGEDFGEVVPVSPLIAAIVAGNRQEGQRRAQAVLQDIRRASARQHLDYVLIYEVARHTERRGNALALGNLTILGAFVLPSRELEIEATASGLFLDVRNGYPYATLTSFAEKQGRAAASKARARERDLVQNTSALAVDHLADEFQTALGQLAARATALTPAAADTSSEPN